MVDYVKGGKYLTGGGAKQSELMCVCFDLDCMNVLNKQHPTITSHVSSRGNVFGVKTHGRML